ncbi:DgyrCDS8767 [Dimorphilus gyrociliatus]|uniref:DgyrCDS8767 n=1 Tax=Dimorphilus gyrociliatus TaxID=2664684 RepID=A0A7I8VXG9_9ANNE|nr:DgyrCDS8767 [Dimorphilus gyrociliatus]
MHGAYKNCYPCDEWKYRDDKCTGPLYACTEEYVCDEVLMENSKKELAFQRLKMFETATILCSNGKRLQANCVPQSEHDLIQHYNLTKDCKTISRRISDEQTKKNEYNGTICSVDCKVDDNFIDNQLWFYVIAVGFFGGIILSTVVVIAYWMCQKFKYNTGEGSVLRASINGTNDTYQNGDANYEISSQSLLASERVDSSNFRRQMSSDSESRENRQNSVQTTCTGPGHSACDNPSDIWHAFPVNRSRED